MQRDTANLSIVVAATAQPLPKEDRYWEEETPNLEAELERQQEINE